MKTPTTSQSHSSRTEVGCDVSPGPVLSVKLWNLHVCKIGNKESNFLTCRVNKIELV